MPRDLNIPNLQQLKQTDAFVQGQVNYQRYPLYYILDLPASSTATEMTFFGASEGGSVVVGSTTINMTAERTNMTKAGSLPSPFSFWLTNIRLVVMPEVDATSKFSSNGLDDVYKFLSKGYAILTIGQKEVQKIAPLWLISSGCGISLDGTTGDSSLTKVLLTNRHPLLYKIDPPIHIKSDVNFLFKIKWDSAPTPTSLIRVAVVFDGYMIGLAQV